MRHEHQKPAKAPSCAARAVQRERMHRFRERMKAMGMRQIALWVPDTASPAIRDEARRQSLALARSEAEARTMDFLEALAEPGDWEE